MSPVDRILLQVNLPATLLTILEATFSYIYWAYAIGILGSVSLANLTVAVFWTAVFIFELPTGYLVDRYGPKVSLAMSTSLRGIAFALFYLANETPYLIWIANAVAGIAVSFLSGLFMLQIRLELERSGLDVNHVQISRSITLVRGIGAVVGTLTGYITLREINAASVWLVAAVISLCMLTLVVLTWHRVRAPQVTTRFAGFCTGVAYSLGRSDLRRAAVDLSIWRAFTAIVVANIVILFVPALQRAPEELLVFYVLTGAMTIASSYLGRQLLAHQNDPEGKYVAVTVVAFAAALYLRGALAWIAYAVAVVLIGIVEQQIRARFFAHIPTSAAASLSSVQSLLANGLTMLAFTLAGMTVAQVGVEATCIASVGVIAIRWSFHLLHTFRKTSVLR